MEYKTTPELLEACADLLIQEAHLAIQARGFFSLVLSGGNTPRGLYALLAQSQRKEALDWSKIYIFWGDERCVSKEHPESNFRMGHETLLEKITIPQENIFRMPGELEPESGAASYEKVLTDFSKKHPEVMREPAMPPAFDLILLGLGLDGHTASLFPNSAILSQEKKWVCAVAPPHIKPTKPRLTLSLPVINQGHNVWFIVTGVKKRQITQRVVLTDPIASPYPASQVAPQGLLRWFVCFES